MVVCHFSQCSDVGNIAQRVANRFAVNCFGARVDQFAKRCRIAVICKTHLNAHLREGVGKQVVGTAV